MAERPGVLVYFETGRAIKGLDYETKGRLFEAILEYAEMGIVPDFDGILSAIWPFVAEKIDRDSVRYADIQEKNRIKGLVSNFKRNYAPAHGIDLEDKAALAAYIAEQTPAPVNSGQQQSTVVDHCQPIQPTATTTATPTATTTATTTATPTETANATVAVGGIRGEAFASSDADTDYLISEEKKRVAIQRMKDYGKGF